MPGYKASVVDDQGHPVSDGEIGELWLEGESTAILYWNDHIKSKETFLGDRIHTGDMFKRDEDGYFWYQGRADSLMKVSGIWLSPIEIENCLREHPDVRECAVVGYSEGGLVLPRAFVVPRDMALASLAMAVALQAYVREQLAPHKYPRDVCFVREIPKTSSGKLDRKALLFDSEQARSQN